MILTDLPAELLVLICKRMTPSTFAIAVTACSTFWSIALKNRKLLLMHLWRIPGSKQGFEDLTNAELLRLCRRRAAENLLGVEVLLDRNIYRFDPIATSAIDAAKSAICLTASPAFALVCHSCPLVHLYDPDGQGGLTARGVLDAIGCVRDHARQPYEIIKVVYTARGGISVLHRPIDHDKEDACSITHLYQPRCKSPGKWLTAHGLLETPASRKYPGTVQPGAVAVARPGLVAVSWNVEYHGFKSNLVWLYSARYHPDTKDRRKSVLSNFSGYRLEA
jgi:hypothetical protein